jgi:hypothetical protein
MTLFYREAKQGGAIALAPARSRVWQNVTFGLCILLAAALRLAIFPHGHSPAYTDEANYLTDGLNFIEGIVPGNKYAPAGPTTWFTAFYAGVGTIVTWLSNSGDLSGFSGLLRPVAALEATLFHIYADMATLRLSVVALTVALTLVSVGAMYRLGQAAGAANGCSDTGIAPAVIGALLAATVPIYVVFSVQTRPYAVAWAFALMALAAIVAGRGRWATVGAGILLGLAIGSHIDMVRIGPLALLLSWRRSWQRDVPPWRDCGTLFAASVVTFLVIAPWYVTHLIDNVRQIISVRFLPAPHEQKAWQELLSGGIAIPLAVATVALLLSALRRRWPDLLCGLWLALNVAILLRVSSHGLFHDGALVVMIIALTPLGVAQLQDLVPALRRPAGAAALVVVVAGLTVYQGAVATAETIPNLAPDDAVAWVEAHVPAGTRVYSLYRIAMPLPTPAASERLWDDVAEPEAWVPKYIYDTTQKFKLGGAWPLRVMSQDRIASDYGFRRRYYILGVPLDPKRPRYDLWEDFEGSFYDRHTDAIVADLCQHGGVYIRYGTALSQLPAPAMAWVRPDDTLSTYIYWVKPGTCPARAAKPRSFRSPASAPSTG